MIRKDVLTTQLSEMPDTHIQFIVVELQAFQNYVYLNYTKIARNWTVFQRYVCKPRPKHQKHVFHDRVVR